MNLIDNAYYDFFKGISDVVYMKYKDRFLVEDLSVYFSDYNDFFEMEKQLLTYVSGKTIDVGAGPGRITLYLQEKGIDVVAVDNSPIMREIGLKRGVKKYELENIFRLSSVSEKFDTVIVFGNTIGVCKNIDELEEFFEILEEILTENGKILLTATSPEQFNFSKTTKINMELIYKDAKEPFSWHLFHRNDIVDAASTAFLGLDYIDEIDGLTGFIFSKEI